MKKTKKEIRLLPSKYNNILSMIYLNTCCLLELVMSTHSITSCIAIGIKDFEYIYGYKQTKWIIRKLLIIFCKSRKFNTWVVWIRRAETMPPSNLCHLSLYFHVNIFGGIPFESLESIFFNKGNVFNQLYFIKGKSWVNVLCNLN